MEKGRQPGSRKSWPSAHTGSHMARTRFDVVMKCDYKKRDKMAFAHSLFLSPSRGRPKIVHRNGFEEM